ncbi:MAG: ral secretion pathway protein [Blastocatellia bacterium]|jgi:general secretion pathway protein D|nr:ral secretion pathway protein [Blastocatellia bacterium]
MKSRVNLRTIFALLVVACMLSAPVMALGKKGNGHFKKGMEFEKAQQWEKAAQEFTLAVAADPSNVEYQLHYRRSMFNASQSFMTQGRALAEQRDYLGGYNAFRQAFAYDPVNQLAVSEMERMLRLQSVKDGGTGTTADGKSAPAPEDEAGGSPSSGSTMRAVGQEPIVPPARSEVLRSVIYSGDLKAFIRTMAEQLNLNVIFDRTSFAQPRTIDITLHDVTTAQALDYVFLQETLFFQKLSRRTVLVADQTRRAQYQQLVLRTFYLANMKPADAQRILTAAIPASVGRPQTIVVPDEATNSLTVRDTAENVRLIGELLTSIDKDRAEVVMDVNIYEVSSSDFMQFGNQLGDDKTLVTLGGNTSSAATFNGLSRVFTGAAGASLPAAFGAALILPASSLQALQTKNNTRLIASTQVHAFTGEESTARIGQRVPVQTAQAYPFGVQTGTGTGTTNNGFPTGGFPVINYEPTGLTLSFTPQVFPNLDVQVKMKIESKDVLGASTLTPTFTERTITGTARVQNNRTMLLASVAQDVQSNGRKGLPLLGLIPVLGRLFTAPTKDNRRVDIVIAVTPRVLRAPAVTPRDEQMRPSGTLSSPTTGSLEAMLRETDNEDRLAEIAAARVAARQVPTNVVVQLPDAEPGPGYIAAPKALATNTAVATTNGPATSQATTVKPASIPAVVPAEKKDLAANMPTPIDTSVTTPAYVQRPGEIQSPLRNLSSQSASTSSTPAGAKQTPSLTPMAQNLAPAILALAGEVELKADAGTEAAKRIVGLGLTPESQELRTGAKQSLSVDLKSEASLGMAVIALRFDPRVIKITSIGAGSLFSGSLNSPTITRTIDDKGLILVSITPGVGTIPMNGEGSLLKIDFEAVSAGESAFAFDTGNVHLVAADGGSLVLQLGQARVTVKQ